MIRTVTLTAVQLRSLANCVERRFIDEGLEPTGLEVSDVQDEGDCYKAFVVYEFRGRNCHNSIYFTARIEKYDVADFKEVWFGEHYDRRKPVTTKERRE